MSVDERRLDEIFTVWRCVAKLTVSKNLIGFLVLICVDVSRLMYVDDRIDHVVTPKP